MTNGILCDIKKFSVHDGPGIRTTLFLKGCPLHCRWCHNPETIDTKPELGVFLNKCVGCGACAEICRCHEIVDGKHIFHRDSCIACGKCVERCRFDALEFYGRRVTVAEAVAEILEDRPFYETSGGGATLSGGEPLLQPDFCAGVFQELKRHEIHTAIETCGEVPWRAFEKVLPWTDLFLYDFKHNDPDCHCRLTGRNNVRIKENLLKLSQTGKAIEIHLPLIPGCNSDPEALDAAGRFLKQLTPPAVVRLLPYHSLAHAKYAAVGRRDDLPDVSTPSPEMMASCAAILERHGLEVRY